MDSLVGPCNVFSLIYLFVYPFINSFILVAASFHSFYLWPLSKFLHMEMLV